MTYIELILILICFGLVEIDNYALREKIKRVLNIVNINQLGKIEDVDYLINETRSLEDKFKRYTIFADENWEEAEKRVSALEKLATKKPKKLKRKK